MVGCRGELHVYVLCLTADGEEGAVLNLLAGHESVKVCMSGIWPHVLCLSVILLYLHASVCD